MDSPKKSRHTGHIDEVIHLSRIHTDKLGLSETPISYHQIGHSFFIPYLPKYALTTYALFPQGASGYLRW